MGYLLREHAGQWEYTAFGGFSTGGPDEHGEYEINQHWFGETGRMHLRQSMLGAADRTKNVMYIAFSLWFLAAAFMVTPVAWASHRALRRRGAHARIQARLCPTCFYNLTDNASGVCPECGTTTAKGSA